MTLRTKLTTGICLALLLAAAALMVINALPGRDHIVRSVAARIEVERLFTGIHIDPFPGGGSVIYLQDRMLKCFPDPEGGENIVLFQNKSDTPQQDPVNLFETRTKSKCPTDLSAWKVLIRNIIESIRNHEYKFLINYITEEQIIKFLSLYLG